MRVALAGGGTVGGGVLHLLRDNAELIAARCGRRIEACAVAVRDVEKAKKRLPEFAPLFVRGWKEAVAHPAAEAVVELMGGEDDAAACIKAALKGGKAVVTANKALLAARGDEIFSAAREAGQPVAFEAAIAGCIPAVKTLREALAADEIHEVAGVVNGTCNYIVSSMSDNGESFDDALAQAQDLGYAEADPSLDIDGDDSAHKIALIARLAFGARIAPGSFDVSGVRGLDLRDVEYAAQFGFSVKILAQARRMNGSVAVAVQPTLVPRAHPMAAIGGAMNAVLVRSAFAGETLYYGAGAGAQPTAAAVAADLVDVARGSSALRADCAGGESPSLLPPEEFSAPHFLRLRVLDRPGALAGIAGALAEQNASIEAIRQNESAPGKEVDVVLLLHETTRGRANAAVRAIEERGLALGKTVVMPIKRFQ